MVVVDDVLKIIENISNDVKTIFDSSDGSPLHCVMAIFLQIVVLMETRMETHWNKKKERPS